MGCGRTVGEQGQLPPSLIILGTVLLLPAIPAGLSNKERVKDRQAANQGPP